MEVNDALVENLCKLACLEFDTAGKQEIKKDLQNMIGFVEKLKEVDTSHTEPLLHMTDALNVYREDIVKGSMNKHEALANAPSASDNYFKVPKVIKK